jgi:hypothetical protein
MPATLPADHDDDNGGVARRRSADARRRHGGRDPAAAGYAIVGGLIVSQALTLYTTPVVFLYLDWLDAWFTGTSHRKVRAMAGRTSNRQIPPALTGNIGD